MTDVIENFLCRGRSLKGGGYIYGNYVGTKTGGKARHFIYGYTEWPDAKKKVTIKPVEVDGDSVGRYSGVRSSQGTRLYEWDCCRLPTGQVGVVRFFEGMWGVCILKGYTRVSNRFPEDSFISFKELADRFSNGHIPKAAFPAVQTMSREPAMRHAYAEGD